MKCPAIAAPSNAQVHDGGGARIPVLPVIALPAEAQDALKVHEDPRGHLSGHQVLAGEWHIRDPCVQQEYKRVLLDVCGDGLVVVVEDGEDGGEGSIEGSGLR